MGILDDAIREHLDLKRRRGADPTEIERAEREALGPVRRGPEVTGEETAPAAPATEPEAAYPPEPAEQWDTSHEDPELEALEEDEDLPAYAPVPAPDGDPLVDHEPFADERESALTPHPADVAPEPAPDSGDAPGSPPAAPHRDERPPHLEQETEEYDVELEEEAEHEGDDDVLETTPEFLQDAPEHDRLWFEQRPPRDFDFDG
jgi:hypothetical protein